MIEGMKKHIARGIMAGLCLFWIVLGILTLENSIIMAILLMLNGVVFGFLAFVCKSKNRVVRWLVYIYIAVNIILTLTDQMGMLDWIVLVIYILLIGFLLMEERNPKTNQEQ